MSVQVNINITFLIDGIVNRVAPDIRPFLYPVSGRISGFFAGYPVSLPDIRLAGYRISGIDEIVDIVSNVNYIVLILKIEKI